VNAFALEESWEVIRQVFPADLERIARQSGSWQRARKVANAETLLRLLLLHAAGLSLQHTALRARQQGLGRLSAVALFKRLRRSGPFLQQLAAQLLAQARRGAAPAPWPGGYRVRLIDSTTVKEPGLRGQCWRVHYSVGLPDLGCDHLELTDAKAGESFKRWAAAPNEVLVAGRAYASCEAVGALLDGGVKVVVRLNGRNFPLLTQDGQQAFALLGQLRQLQAGQVGDWALSFRFGERCWPIRLSAVRKSQTAAERARRKVRDEGRQVQAQTLELSEYVLVLSNLEPENWSATSVLELYRYCWQIERAFKRLKRLLKLGHLPKKDPDSARAWLQLKLLLALITEQLCERARFFAPWGYRLEP